MQHILSLSYGKDSLACLGAIEQLGWPLDPYRPRRDLGYRYNSRKPAAHGGF